MAPVNRIDETPNDRISRLEKQVDELSRALGRTTSGLRDDDRMPLVRVDRTTGQGLGRPYIPIPFSPADWPTAPNTASTVPVTVWVATFPKQHPALRMRISTIASATVTGVAQLWLNGSQIGPDYPIVESVVGMARVDIGPVPVVGAVMDNVTAEIKAFVTGGVGAAYVTVNYAYGCELSV